jgi:tetratricopeptide (TPR) repeat protein
VKPKVASVAIIPLFNESPEGGFEHIGHGLGEHLASRLAGLEGLRVQPYQRWVKGEPEEVCEQLKVEGVLEGSYAVQGGAVEARVDLVRADGTRELLAQTSSEGYKSAAEELANAVARGLKRRLTAAEAAQVSAPSAGSNEAFEALSKGVDLQQRAERDEALRWYERAVALDPGLARGYVGIGSIRYDRYFRGRGDLADLAVAKANFRQALALEPGNDGALRGLVMMAYEETELESLLALGERAARRGTGLDTLIVPAWAYTLTANPWLGSRAVEMVERVLAVDPMNREALWLLVMSAAWSEQYDKAVEAGERYLRAFENDPEVAFWTAEACWQRGDRKEAVRLIENALDWYGDTAPHYALFRASDLLRASGKEAKARELDQEALRLCLQRREIVHLSPRIRDALCQAYVRLGRLAAFLGELEAMERSSDPGFSNYEWLNPAYQDPRCRQRVIEYAERHLSRTHYFWVAVTPVAVSDQSLDIRKDPRLARQAAAARAYQDSLLRRYGIPPRPAVPS